MTEQAFAFVFRPWNFPGHGIFQALVPQVYYRLRTHGMNAYHTVGATPSIWAQICPPSPLPRPRPQGPTKGPSPKMKTEITFFTPTSPQNGGIDICFVGFKPILNFRSFWAVFFCLFPMSTDTKLKVPFYSRRYARSQCHESKG